jgi:hypothetical protein
MPKTRIVVNMLEKPISLLSRINKDRRSWTFWAVGSFRELGVREFGGERPNSWSREVSICEKQRKRSRPLNPSHGELSDLNICRYHIL